MVGRSVGGASSIVVENIALKNHVQRSVGFLMGGCGVGEGIPVRQTKTGDKVHCPESKGIHESRGNTRAKR